MNDQGTRTSGARPDDHSELSTRVSVQRVSAALCAVTGRYTPTTDATTRKVVAAVLRECETGVERTGAVEFDAESGEFRTAAGDIRLAVDRFPVDAARWDGVVGAVAVVGLVAAGASWAGLAGSNGGWVAVVALALVLVGSMIREAFRADVSVSSRRD
ncbi:MAG: hypothetical protein ABEJ43_03545 [Haloferacaceae archaeon]